MGTRAFARTAILASLMLGGAGEASAGLFRTYLSVSGSDANACTLPSPCRLLPAAIAAANSGGEVWMLDSANFNTGTVSVNKSLTILAVPGALGSIVANGADAISINTPGVAVTLRNVVIVNLSGGTNAGVSFMQGNELTVEGSEIYGVNLGVSILAAGSTTTIKDTIIRDTTAAGVVQQGSSKLQLRNAGLLNNFNGMQVSNGASVSIAGSAISGSTFYGIFVNASGSTTAQLAASNSTITGNTAGLGVVATTGTDTAQAMLSNVTFSQNSIGVSIAGATATVYSLTNNTFKYNTNDVTGAALTPLAAQ